MLFRSTEGISITHLFPKIEKDNKLRDTRLNIWDFSGQEIDYSTHQFFLTHNAVYLFVFNSRKNDEENNFKYWMNIIQTLSPESPVIGIMNSFDNQTDLFTAEQWREQYPKVTKFIRVDCGEKSNKGIENLWDEIKHQVKGLKVFGVDWPVSFANVRQDLEDLSKSTKKISVNLFRDICTKNQLNDTLSQDELAKFLTDIGTIIHYPNPSSHLSETDNELLQENIFLDSEWATKAVYLLVRDNQEKIRNNAAAFTRAELVEYWENLYDRTDFKILLALVKRFDLCFQMEQEERYILPQLLSASRPAGTTIQSSEKLRFRLQYEDAMPKGIITRFICKQHQRIKKTKGNLVYWRDGVVLEYEGETTALIHKISGKDIIDIEISGKRRRDFLSIIRDNFDQIHKPLNNLQPKEVVGCICKKCLSNEFPHFFNYTNLIKKFESGRYHTEMCMESDLDVEIRILVDNIGSVNRFLREEVKKLIQKGRLEEAINSLPESQDKSLLESRFTQLKTDQVKGLITREEYHVLSNNLSMVILKFTSGGMHK